MIKVFYLCENALVYDVLMGLFFKQLVMYIHITNGFLSKHYVSHLCKGIHMAYHIHCVTQYASLLPVSNTMCSIYDTYVFP